MTMPNFLDANVWLALIWERHIHSERAREWLNAQGEDGQFCYCRFTQLTVLRLLTTQTIMGQDTATMSQAWGVWDKVCADSRISFVPEAENLEPELRSRSRSAMASPKVWADAYLLAFAAMAGLRLVTFDRALKTPKTEVLVL